VGIVGTGVMGTGIARVLAAAGLDVTLVKWTEGPFEGRRDAFIRSVEKDRDQKKSISQEEAARIIHGVRWTLAPHPLERCDLVIEAIVEDEAEKLKCFATIEPVLKQSAILASTTSSLSIEAMAKATGRPRLFLGLHFFNPPTAMKLVELVVTETADPQCVQAIRAFLGALGKQAVEVRDEPGFVVNRLLVGQFLEAVRMAFDDAPVADIVGIDACMRFGANHPMGPFELMDFIGLDVVLAMANNLQDDLRQQQFAPPTILENLVAAEMLGRKTGAGFYDYADRKNPRPNPELGRLNSSR